jgi:peroxiredoxin-like protein
VEPKKTYRAFRYKADVAWTSARRGLIKSLGKHDVEVGSPPEFKGEPGVWSPEELLVGAVNTCMMLTFLAFAVRREIEPVSYESSAEGMLENVDGQYRITQVTVQPSIVLKSEADLAAAQEIMKSVKENCFISNSLTGRVTLSPQLRVGA